MKDLRYFKNVLLTYQPSSINDVFNLLDKCIQGEDLLANTYGKVYNPVNEVDLAAEAMEIFRSHNKTKED